MLLSMTGHGEARLREAGRDVTVEVRTVNNKYFKLTVRASERLAALEPSIENVIREQVRRGTVQVNVWVDRESSPEDYRLNEVVLASYRRQLEQLERSLGCTEPIRLESLLALPGVIDERASHHTDIEGEWPFIERALRAALNNLHQMRREEGKSMAADLRANRQVIWDELSKIEALAPNVVAGYRQRLVDRVNGWLGEVGMQIAAADVVREVGMYAERSDISEEIVRLRSHLDQFESLLSLPDGSGRKLEFLTQEMFREANTIGSKANDAQINHHVIEIKTAIERLREMIQNVE